MVRTRLLMAATAGVALTFASVGPAAATTATRCPGLTAPRLSISFSNTGPMDARDVYITFTANSSGGIQPCRVLNHSVRLSDLPRYRTGPHWRHIEIGSGVSSGLIWISYRHPLTGLPATQPSFDTSMTRFANVELSFPGQADMTNVDQFSIPVDLVTYATRHGRDHLEKRESRWYKGTSCDIVGKLKSGVQSFNSTYSGILAPSDLATWSQIVVRDPNNNNAFVRAVSPKQRAHQPPTVNGQPNPYASGWPSMAPYVAAMANQPITIEGLFSPGNGSAYTAEAGWYQYTGTFAADGSISLTGSYGATSSPGGAGNQAGSTIAVASSLTHASGTIDGLVTGIYDQASEYSVGGVARNTGSASADAPNDVYNSVYRDLTSAFTYGYPGGRYGSNSNGWWNSWAPPAAPSGGQPAFATARTNPNPTTGGDQFLAANLWSQTLFGISQNYSIPYGENYGSGAPNRPSPLLNLPKGTEFHLTIGKDGPAGCLDSL